MILRAGASEKRECRYVFSFFIPVIVVIEVVGGRDTALWRGRDGSWRYGGEVLDRGRESG
jgi:hypothetical protein